MANGKQDGVSRIVYTNQPSYTSLLGSVAYLFIVSDNPSSLVAFRKAILKKYIQFIHNSMPTLQFAFSTFNNKVR